MVIKAINFFIFPPTPHPLYKPWFHFIFTSQIILPVKENIISSSLAALPQVRRWQRREELTLIGRGCARALPFLPQAPLLLSPAPQLSTQLPITPPLLLPASPQPPTPLPSQLAPTQLLLPILLEMLRVPPLWPLPRGGIILGLGPHHQPLYTLDQPGGPHRPRGPGHQAQGSHLHPDLRRRRPHLIRVLPEPQTYLRGPSSGDLTSLATPSREMLAAEIEIFMGRCTMISQHLLWTRGSETPCSSYNNTIWSHSWCSVSTIILGSSPSSITR